MGCLAEDVYYSLIGALVPDARVADVENAFAEGKLCERLYRDVVEANARLCQRLGVEDEDADVELIINSLLDIEKELCIRMYEYGVKFGAGK